MNSANCYRAMQGWFAGCWVTTAVFWSAALVMVALTPGGMGPALPLAAMLMLPYVVLTFVITCVLTGIPASVIIWLSESFHVRSILFFGCAGAAIGGVIEAALIRDFRLDPASIGLVLFFMFAGLAAGLTYWRVAGQYAGRQ
jgi:hypothetical protein